MEKWVEQGWLESDEILCKEGPLISISFYMS